MLWKTELNDARVQFPLQVLDRHPNRILSFLSSLLLLTLSVGKASALPGQVGVVKSRENVLQWGSISARLRETGINYCVVDAANWQEARDLGNVGVLVLPNVENISGAQAEALETWIQQGGRAIVTGPTGSFSEPAVRSQLRSLLGAYWGFANPSPSALRLSESPPSGWSNRPGLTGTLFGGVVIPTAANSQAAAVWLSQDKAPAVVVSDRATFLGWRWGVDAVAPAALDTAWLQAALERYGISRTPILNGLNRSEPLPCNPNEGTPQPPTPLLPGVEIPLSPLPQEGATLSRSPLPPSPPPPALVANRPERSFPLPWQPASRGAIAPQQVAAMSQELESLIARFESTLLAAEASHNRTSLPASQRVEKSLPQRSPVPKEKAPAQPAAQDSPHQVLREARNSLDRFHQLVGAREYGRARHLWLQARRSLWDHYPTDRPFAQPEVRAMWLDRGTIVQAKSEADLAGIFDRMARAGINTVFFETVNSSYPIYPSRVAPEQNPLTRGWDPLKAAVKLAHERGMELHAWVWVFAATNQGHNEILGQPPNYLGPVLSRNPDWAIADREGNVFDRGVQYRKAFLDPANPAVQKYLLALLEEIATNYGVDGIQLDYIRYPFQDPKIHQTFGYSNSSRWQFKQLTGVDPMEISPSHPLWSQWTGFRIRQIDSFVATASARLKGKRPDLILSAAVFPLERRERLFRLQQNWEEWMERGQVDLIVLMTYAVDTGNLEERTRPLFDRSLPGASLVIPGLRLLKVPDPVTFDQLQYLRNLPASGFALFAAENLTPTLQDILTRTQGPAKGPLPYRQPFQAAAARYHSLKGEWSFLLANQQLLVEEKSLPGWAKQVDSLGEALQQLAERPSEQRLAAARANLAQFQRQFGNWMGRQQSQRPYQVQVWQNRLQALHHLLDYGEQWLLSQGQGRRPAHGGGSNP